MLSVLSAFFALIEIIIMKNDLYCFYGVFEFQNNRRNIIMEGDNNLAAKGSALTDIFSCQSERIVWGIS